MKKIINGFLSSVAIFALVSCGGGSSDTNSPSGLLGSYKEIKTKNEAENSIYAISKFVLNGNTQGMDLGEISRSLNTNLPTLNTIQNRATETEQCNYGGSITYNGQNQHNFNVTLNNCTEFRNITMNGNIKNSNIQYNSNDDLVSGIMTYQNFITQTHDIQTYSTNLKTSLNVNYADSIINILYNGDFSISQKQEKFDFTMQNYKIDMFITQKETQINGDIAINNSPANCNIKGNYNIKTLSPLKFNYRNQQISSGKMNVNGIIYNFKDDKTIDVTLNDKTINIKQGDNTCK